MKKLTVIIIAFLTLLLVPSCDYVNAGVTVVKSVVPKPVTGYPDFLNGTYKVLTESGNNYTSAIMFAKDGSFDWRPDVDDTASYRSGTYTYEYRVFQETEMAGVVTMSAQDGSTVTEKKKNFVLKFDKKSGQCRLSFGGLEYVRTGDEGAL
jgi:hypothetical protein